MEARAASVTRSQLEHTVKRLRKNDYTFIRKTSLVSRYRDKSPTVPERNCSTPRILERKPVNCFFAMELCLPVWCWVGSFGILQHWLAIKLGLRKWRVAQHILRLWPQWTARWAARCHRSWVGCRVRSCSSIDRRTRRTNVSSPCSSGRCSPQEICNASSVGTPPWDVTARTARRMK